MTKKCCMLWNNLSLKNTVTWISGHGDQALHRSTCWMTDWLQWMLEAIIPLLLIHKHLLQDYSFVPYPIYFSSIITTADDRWNIEPTLRTPYPGTCLPLFDQTIYEQQLNINSISVFSCLVSTKTINRRRVPVVLEEGSWLHMWDLGAHKHAGYCATRPLSQN